MVGRRILTWGGLGAVGAGTYYLYSAGGDPKLAEKKFERTMSRNLSQSEANCRR